MYRHSVPNELDVEDSFLFGLTLRQCLILGIGASVAYASFSDLFDAIADHQFALILGLIVAAALCMMSVAFAFGRIAQRTLSEWLLLLLVFTCQPHIYLWGLAPRERAPISATMRSLEEDERR